MEKNLIGQNGNFQFEEDPFSKGVQSNNKVYHEVLLILQFLQIKPQVENMKIKYYDLYYTNIKNRDEREVVKITYEKK